MRRAILAASVLCALLFAPAAEAASPSLGALEATNVQGVSALIKGTVDPEGKATTYRFQYGTAPDFTGATDTPSVAVGDGTEPLAARAAISGLEPDTTYHFRLLATNADGTSSLAGSFATTQGFGLRPGTDGFSVEAIADGGEAATITGSHPYRLAIGLGLREGGEFEDQPGVAFADGDLRDLEIELPPGLFLNPTMVNPSASTVCATAVFNMPRTSPFASSRSGESCPAASQVGTVEVKTSREGGATRRFGVFNLEAPHGVAAQIGFAPFGSPIVMSARLRGEPGGRHGLTLAARDIPQALDMHGLTLVLWGAPWATSHNTERGNCLNEAEPDFPWAKCPVPIIGNARAPAYLTLPIECSQELSFAVRAGSWQQDGEASAVARNLDSGGEPAPMEGCESIPFDPLATATLTTRRASSPSGFDFDLINQGEGITDFAGRAPAPPRRISVALPEGVTVNPSVGAGLGACTPAQYAAETAFNGQGQGQGCPNASKLGGFTTKTPLFAGETMQGAIYLAQPDEPSTATPGAENPFDTLISLYFVAKLPGRGILVKVAGKVAADPLSGRLHATFSDLPQLPYSEVEVSFQHGRRPFLAAPAACGTPATVVEIAPWVQGPATAKRSTPAPIEVGLDGPCPSGQPPFSPGVSSGGVNAHVGAYTPYFVHLGRRDSEQEITSYSLVLPKGITGKLAGIPFCGEAAIAAARVKRGFAEIADPSCPAASQVGRVETGYGVGAALAYAPGKVYLAGPYNGQPLSLVAVNAATIGPFDLGTYVIRSAFAVDPLTAQLQIDARASDPIPHIVEGIPLHVRDIRVHMDRFQFTHNPSSCAASKLISTLTGSGTRFGDPSDDSTATVSSHFQLLNCLVLGFRPKLGLRLRGGVRRGAHPSLRATFASRGAQDSNLKRIEVSMPRSLFLANNHIRTVCTRPQFDAERCPKGSVYGSAVAHTLLFDKPLRGDVYLRSSSRNLPDLVASLRAGEVRIVVEGRIGPSRKGGIRAFFDELPDAPLDRFTMTLHGGRRGLLENTQNICVDPPLASVRALGQNNLGAIFNSKLRGQCGKKKRKQRKAKRASAHRGGGMGR